MIDFEGSEFFNNLKKNAMGNNSDTEEDTVNDGGVDTSVVVGSNNPSDVDLDQHMVNLFSGVVNFIFSALAGDAHSGAENHQGGFVPDTENEREVHVVYVVGDCKKNQ